MCGRYALEGPQGDAFRQGMAEMRAHMRQLDLERRQLTGYDIRPTTICGIVMPGGGLDTARWGWEREFATGGRIINARWETAAEKRTFAQAVERRRCVIPASAYYEWRRDERDRPLEKFAFKPASGLLFSMAGLFEEVQLPDGSERRFLVLTRPMVLHATIHDRTPIMLSQAGEEAWLDADAPMGEVIEAAQSLGDADVVVRGVCSGPTKAKPAGAHLLESLGEPWFTENVKGPHARIV